MKIKKGDNVKIISGADKGKTGKVLHSFPKTDRVLVEGVNMKKRHEKSRRQGQTGQIIDKPMSIHISNVALTEEKPKVEKKPKKAAAKK